MNAPTPPQAAPDSLSTLSGTSPPTLGRSSENLIWLDCEMTGLDPDRDRIIEIAVIATGPHLEPRIEGPVIVLHQPDAQLDLMDAWNKGTHGKSGLTDKVRASQTTEALAQAQVLEFVSRFIPKGTSPMCGNSISQDRRFLVKYMPELEAWFHYRNLDVSTLKEIMKRWRPDLVGQFKKKQLHTALADVHESIDELVFYRERMLAVPAPGAAL